MFNNCTSNFNVSFLGFDNMHLVQFESLLKQHAAYLNDVEINRDKSLNETVHVIFINDCEKEKIELPAVNDGRIICAGKFNDFGQILKMVHQGYYGCISCTAIYSEIIPALVSALQKKVYVSSGFNSIIHSYFQNNTANTGRHCLFTEQEHILVQHLTAGALYKEIASELKISENTVRSHVRNIYSKLKVHSKTELAQKILKGNLMATFTYFLPDFIACLCY